MSTVRRRRSTTGSGAGPGAGAAYGGYTVALRNMPKLHWQSTMIALSTGALLSATVFAIVEWLAGFGRWPDSQGWPVIAYTAIFPSVLSRTFYIRGNRLIGGNRAGLFVNPALILAERFQLFHATALALVFGGIWLAERRRFSGGG